MSENMSIEKIIIVQIAKLFASRNMARVEGMAEAWIDDLKVYDPMKIVNAFNRFRKYGDNFPSLPSIIALIESRVDSETASIDAWANIRKAMKASSSKSLTPAEKEVMNRVSTGISELIDSDSYKLSTIERDFKKLYKSGYDGISREILIEPSGAVQLLQSEQIKSIENNGMFKND